MGEQDEGLGATESQSSATEVVTAFGYILAVSYPILALSTGVRALFQLFFKEGVENYLPPCLSLLAAVCYLTATIGFARRQRWGWWLSVSVLGFGNGTDAGRRRPQLRSSRGHRAHSLAALWGRLRLFSPVSTVDWPRLAVLAPDDAAVRSAA